MGYEMKYYVILEESCDPFLPPSLYEDVVYTKKEDAEKRLKEITSWSEVFIHELEVK